MIADASRLPRLPACRACSKKKVKCDSSRPKCQACTRNGSDCVMYDSESQDWVSREYIHQLEKNAEGAVSSNAAPQQDEAERRRPPSTLPSPGEVSTGPSRSKGGSTAIAKGAGMSFISLLFADAGWRRSNADLLKSLNQAPQGPKPLIEPCELPSSSVVEHLFDRYLNWSHILNPILLRQDIFDLHRRLFASDGTPTQAASHDLFRGFIICAIAAVIPYRTGTHPQHPEGYYRAALHNIGPYLLTRGLDSIQDLLLIGKFGVYHHIGISIWELIQLCGRLCTEQGLHCGDAETGNLLQDQKMRRVFWQVYLVDRYSSIALDRPFAIDDASIEIGLPADADDDDLVSASPSIQTLDAFARCVRPVQHTEVTVFLFCVRLRQLSSRITAQLCKLRQDPSLHTQPYLAVGRICAALNSLLLELETWYQSAPAIPNPRCLYESFEWFSLLYCREKIDLIRRAVDLVPKANGAPPRHMVTLFLKAALQVINNYSALSERKGFITYTRNYFHMMFTAGLSVMYCTSVSQGLTHVELIDISHGLQTCESTLSSMSEQLADAGSYTAVFGALHRHISNQIHRNVGNPAPEGTGPFSNDQAPSAGAHLSTLSDTSGPLLHPFHQQRTALDANGLGSHNSGLNMPGPGWQNLHPAGFEACADPFAGSGHADAVNGDMYRGVEGVPSGDEDLLHWAFLHDESVWNMDMMLGEYVYGHPLQSGPLDNLQM